MMTPVVNRRPGQPQVVTVITGNYVAFDDDSDG